MAAEYLSRIADALLTQRLSYAGAVAPGGSWGAFEVKTNPRAVDDGATSLLKLTSKVDESVVRMAFLAAITASGYAYRRSDGVYAIPISRLAP